VKISIVIPADRARSLVDRKTIIKMTKYLDIGCSSINSYFLLISPNKYFEPRPTSKEDNPMMIFDELRVSIFSSYEYFVCCVLLCRIDKKISMKSPKAITRVAWAISSIYTSFGNPKMLTKGGAMRQLL